MATTPHIGITLVEQAQAQKEVTVNMALMRIDALLNTSVIDKDLTAPPATPEEGDLYIVASPATDAWAGREGDLAYFEQVWRFIKPNEGAMFWVQDEDVFYVFDGADWGATGAGGGGEVNSGQNANGAAGGVFKGKVSTNLVFNNIVAGANVSVSGGGPSGGDIVISAAGGGGGGSGAEEIGELQDVTIATPATGHVLVYDAGNSEWVNQTPADAGLAESGHGHTLADISDAGTLAGKSSVNNTDWSGTPLSVLNGGTGITSVTADRLLRGNGSSAMQVSGVSVDADDCLSGFRGSVKVESGTSYTLTTADSGKIIECQNSGAITLTLPATMPRGFTVTVVQMGAGQVTFSPASGAQLRNSANHNRTAGQYAACALYVSSNSGGSAAVYVMSGDSI